MRFFLLYLAPIIRHPATSFCTGLAMVAAGVMEVLGDMLDEFEPAFGVKHALILLGAVTLLRSFVELVEGTKRLSQLAEQKHRSSGQSPPPPL